MKEEPHTRATGTQETAGRAGPEQLQAPNMTVRFHEERVLGVAATRTT